MDQHIIMAVGGDVEKTESTLDTSVGTVSAQPTPSGSKSISLEDRIAICQQALYDLRAAGVNVQRTKINSGTAAVIFDGLTWDDAGNLVRAGK